MDQAVDYTAFGVEPPNHAVEVSRVAVSVTPPDSPRQEVRNSTGSCVRLPSRWHAIPHRNCSQTKRDDELIGAGDKVVYPALEYCNPGENEVTLGRVSDRPRTVEVE